MKRRDLEDAGILLAVIAVSVVFWIWQDATYARTAPKLGQFRRAGDHPLTQQQIHTLDSLRRIDRTLAGY